MVLGLGQLREVRAIGKRSSGSLAHPSQVETNVTAWTVRAGRKVSSVLPPAGLQRHVLVCYDDVPVTEIDPEPYRG